MWAPWVVAVLAADGETTVKVVAPLVVVVVVVVVVLATVVSAAVEVSSTRTATTAQVSVPVIRIQRTLVDPRVGGARGACTRTVAACRTPHVWITPLRHSDESTLTGDLTSGKTSARCLPLFLFSSKKQTCQ
jgi:hypothetical protein